MKQHNMPTVRWAGETCTFYMSKDDFYHRFLKEDDFPSGSECPSVPDIEVVSGDWKILVFFNFSLGPLVVSHRNLESCEFFEVTCPKPRAALRETEKYMANAEKQKKSHDRAA